MESAYLKWNRGNRVALCGGLEQAEEGTYTLRFSADSQAMYIPLSEGWNPTKEEIVTVAKPNQRLRLIPAFTIKPSKYKVKVCVNPALLNVAFVQCPDIIEIDEVDTQPVVVAKFYKEFDLTTLDYLIKLYLVT